MAQINISDDVNARVMALKPLVESVLEVSLETDRYVELLLRLVPDFIMAEVFGGADAKALYGLLQQLSHDHPETYGAIAEILEKGEHAIEAQTKLAVKRTLGFPEPTQ